MFWAVTLIVLVGACWAIRLQTRYNTFQYLYFLRFPLTLACFLLGFPWLALSVFPTLLANLFVIEAVSHLALVSLLSVLTAWVAMYTSGLILQSGPGWLGVSPGKPPDSGRAWGASIIRGEALPALFFSALAWPWMGVCLVKSELSTLEALTAVGSGLILAWLIRVFLRVVVFRRRKSLSTLRRARRQKRVSIAQEYLGPTSGPLSHAQAGAFFLVTLSVYLAGWLFLEPGGRFALSDSVPALAYLLLIAILAGWALPALSFFLDRYRIPTSLILGAIFWLSYGLFDTDHYYRAVPSTRTSISTGHAYQAWSNRSRPLELRGPVLVTASGGGIAAARWTALVLYKLSSEGPLAGRFQQSVPLISSVSGGSLAALFFVDSFTRNGASIGEDLVSNSGTSSLSASAWGIVYPDFWRVAIAPVFLMSPGVQDRGWALERSWGERQRGGPKPLSGWLPGIREGWRPTSIFNTTIAETGERCLITPGVSWEGSATRNFFHRIYPRADLEAVTAARLSATFPYVTPIARAWDGRPLEPGFHLADGGYYDNSGVLSALDWLESVLDHAKANGHTSALIIRIQTFSDEPGEPAAQKGWLHATIGPLTTLMQVRSASQMARNETEIRLFSELLAGQGFTLEQAVFRLGVPAPLSWHLTRQEKAEIDAGWDSPENQAALMKVRSFLRPKDDS